MLLEALGAFRSMLEELHVAEAALRDSEARSTAILDLVDGIITIDEHGTIASFNPAASASLGIPPTKWLDTTSICSCPRPIGGARWLPGAVSPDG